MSTKPPTVDPTLGSYKTKAIIKGQGPIPNPLEFWFIFVGSEWATTLATDRIALENAIRIIFDSNMFDGLIQYPYLRRPTLGGIVSDSAHEIPDDYFITELSSEAATAATSGLVPFNDTAPAGVTYAHYIIPSRGSASHIPDAYGYHCNQSVTRSNGTKYNVILGVNETDQCYAVAQAQSFPPIEQMTFVITHEVAEMITDPIPFPFPDQPNVVSSTGWTADPNGLLSKISKDVGNEICDVCIGWKNGDFRSDFIGGVSVATYWSDKDGTCVISKTRPTYTTCPSGYTFNNTTQKCINNVNPPPTDISQLPPSSGDVATSDGIPPHPILASKVSHNVGFGGGPVYKPLEIYVIFAGPTFDNNASDATTRDKLTVDLAVMFASPFFDNLIQYGLMPRPKLISSTINILSTPLTNGFTKANLLTYIGHCQDLGLVPSNSAVTGHIKQNIAYLVITAPGVVSDRGVQYNDADLIFGNTYNIFSTATINATDYTVTTTSISRALIDMVANPIPYTGYSMIATAPGYGTTTRDLATICSTTKTVQGITVVNYWSDEDGSCISSSTATPPWLTCKAGYVWNAETQSCEQAASGDGGSGGSGGGGGGTGPGTGGGGGSGGASSGGSVGHSGGGTSPPDPPIFTGTEIHDVCAGTIESKGYITIGQEERVGVVSYYSDVEGICMVPNSNPSWVTCPSGSKWDDSLQECVLDSSRTSDQTEGDTDSGSGPGSGAGGTGDITESPPLVSYTRNWTFRLDVGTNSEDSCTLGNPLEKPVPVVIYDVEPGKHITSFEDMGYAFGNGITEMGAYVTSPDSILYNAVVKKVEVKSIRRITDETDTGPQGYISCYIMNFVTKQKVTFLGSSINVQGMDINEQTLVFDASDNTYPLGVGDVIILWYWDDSATVDRCLRLRRSDINYIDGVSSYLVVRTASGYFANPDADPPFRIYV
jgi:hypothetical protein